MSQSLVDGLNDFYAAQSSTVPPGTVDGNRPWSRPLKSVALAVHVDQIPEAMALAAQAGVPTEFTSDGRPILRDRNHKKRYCRAVGVYDRDAGYGDAAPLHHKGEKAPPSRLRELAKKYAHLIRVRRDNQT